MNKENRLKAIHKGLDRIANLRCISRTEAFHDLIQSLCNGISEQLVKFGMLTQGSFMAFNESFRIPMQGYSGSPEAWKYLGETTVLVVEAMRADPFSDVLGELNVDGLKSYLGQYPTPPDLAELVSVFMQPESTSLAGKSVGDLGGCGFGSLLLGSLRSAFRKHGSQGLRGVHVEGWDVDIWMAKATAAQLCWHAFIHRCEIDIRVVHANAIADYEAINKGEKTLFELKPWLPSRAANDPLVGDPAANDDTIEAPMRNGEIGQAFKLR